MKLNEPRLHPVEEKDWTEEQRQVLKGQQINGKTLNIFKTLVNYPKLTKRWLVFGNHVLSKSSLDPREREMAILRIGWLCDAEYEWGQHALIGKEAGLSSNELEQIKEGPAAIGWSECDKLILQATDELHRDAFISDVTWQSLSQHYNTEQMLDLIFAVGQYNLVSMALNSLGVQLDKGIGGYDDT